MEDLVIRLATERDLDAIYAIESLCFTDPYPHAFLQALHNLNPNTFFVAERAGALVGYVIATEDRGHGHILAIAVHPSERRQGIGTRLITASLQALRRCGAATVRLEVRRSNLAAQRFYEDHGFLYSHTIAGYYDDEDALIYYCDLSIDGR
jgi:ribosomal-protein-alanine N-acetyltransferase